MAESIIDIRYRLVDVNSLRLRICQDFIKMILKDNWKQDLYRKAKKAIDKDSKYKCHFTAAYGRMRDYGIDSYSVENMDVTLICQLIIKCVEDSTRKALIRIRIDRNIHSHADGNEEAEDLYLRALLALCNLRSFVRSVDENEKTIDDEKRLSFRRKYIKEIEELMDILDYERIESIQWKKEINRDVRRALEENDWSNVNNKYVTRYRAYKDYQTKEEYSKDYEKYNYFLICSSDAGIVDAHILTINVFLVKKDYAEAEKRLLMYFKSKPKLEVEDVIKIITSINCLIDKGMTDVLREIIACLRERDYDIIELPNGKYGYVE